MIIAAAGFIGIPETLELLKNNRAELEARFNPVFMYGLEHIGERIITEEILRDALKTEEECAHEDPEKDPGASENGSVRIFPMGDGGIFKTLWDVAESTGYGVEVQALDIPILQETVELCNMYGVDPYRSNCNGAYIILIADDGLNSEDIDSKGSIRCSGNITDTFLSSAEEAGIPVFVIGKTVRGRDKKIIYKDHIRCLNRPE